MKKVLLILILHIPILLLSWTWHVNQDGTGDFTTIQNAVNMAFDNDTIIIHDGIYYEEVDVLNKSLTIASLYHLDGDESHIGNTIFDGENQHRLLRVMNDTFEGVSNIIGISFRNGNAIIVDNSWWLSVVTITRTEIHISNCSFYNNISIHGGGLATVECDVTLSGNSIRNNIATEGGGGCMLFSSDETENFPTIFNDTNLNSIYNNQSFWGSDLLILYDENITPIIADTLSIDSNDRFYNVAVHTDHSANYDLTFQANTTTLPRIESDLFVSPWGDDNNDGLTSATPLRSIWWACSIIAPTVENRLTVHLLPGEYSFSGNDNYFPFYVRDYTTILGDSAGTTILNCEGIRNHIINRSGQSHIKLENLSLINNQITEEDSPEDNWHYEYAIYFEPDYPLAPDYEASLIHLENVKFYQTNYHNPMWLNRTLDFLVSNGKINNCQFGSKETEIVTTQQSIINGNISFWSSGSVEITNTKFFNQREQIYIDSAVPSDVNISNCLFDSAESIPFAYDYTRWYVILAGPLNTNIINNTFYGNHPSHQMDGMIIVSYSGSQTNPSVTNIKNNIMIDNYITDQNNSIYVFETGGPYAAEINVGHNLIPGGEETTHYPDWPNLTFNYEDTNIDTIPHFTGYGKNRFMLDADSPCIDAGTLNLPDGFELPETDLAGNPRVHGDSIDMGCYEWQGNVADFTMQAMGNVFPIDVVFTPQYNFPIDTIAWDLDLDGVIDSYEMNPVWSYPDFNGHSVGMYINDGEAIEIKYDCIQPTTPIIEETNDTPEANELLACYPNPVRISTGNVVIKYNVKDVGNAELKVYNIKGQMVKSIKVKSQRKGRNTIFWYLTDNRGVHVPSGVYLYNLEQNGERIGKGQITVVK